MKKLGLLVIPLALILAWAFVSRTTSTSDDRLLSAFEVRRIVEAPGQHSYSALGETRTWHDGRALSLRIELFHSRTGKHRIEYHTAPLEGVVIVNDGERTWRHDPDLHAVTALAGGCTESANQLELFLQNHEVKRAGYGRTAGRAAYMLEVRSSRSGKIRKRLWVDDDTHIILKSEDYDASGKSRSSMRLDSIRYVDDLSDMLFEQPSSPDSSVCLQGIGKPMSRQELSDAVSFRVRLPGYVPEGFKLDGYQLYECPCRCGHNSAYVRYTDGLTSISIFQSASDSDCANEGRCVSHNGDHSVRDQIALGSEGSVQFIVIADLKSAELTRVIDSLR